MVRNPFHTEALEPGQPFCNRLKEQEELFSHSCNGMNVVLFAPRRFGKTSLVQRVQHRIKNEQSFCTIYCQFFKVYSVDDLVDRFAKAVFKSMHEKMSLVDKGKHLLSHFPSLKVVFGLNPDGSPSLNVEPVQRKQNPLEKLEDLLVSIGRLLEKEDFSVSFALDEFQDIVDLKEPRVEAILREHIQRHSASYIFLGSRRSVLRDIFTNKSRPFYQSATMMELAPLPQDELITFLQEQFQSAGKACSDEGAEWMVKAIGQYPYYAQALAYRAFEASRNICTLVEAKEAFLGLLENERYGYQATVQSLPATQFKLLRALAIEPTEKLTAQSFITEFGLSIGGVQKGIKSLDSLDLVEQHNGEWGVVDPVFAEWLRRSF